MLFPSVCVLISPRHSAIRIDFVQLMTASANVLPAGWKMISLAYLPSRLFLDTSTTCAPFKSTRSCDSVAPTTQGTTSVILLSNVIMTFTTALFVPSRTVYSVFSTAAACVTAQANSIPISIIMIGMIRFFMFRTLMDGKYHDVDSNELSFKMAARLAYKAGIPQANPVVLEPVGSLKVTIPDSFMGDIIGDLNKRRGRVMGMNPAEEEGLQLVEA
ncbi:MAG: hypothetical protein II195_06685, partial [Selenomonadales bacterium]|nr:hypothetical protein [Selenomonadales bacterium]